MPAGVAQVRDFELDMTTDFAAIDFPAGTLSPTLQGARGRRAGGWPGASTSLVTGQRIGMDPPNRLNPGPLAARITFFAPVSLLFFVTVMVILGVLRGQSLHPMHYFFLSAAFFAFHLLLAYLVDHMEMGAAFLIAAAASVFLVVSYLRAGGGLARRPARCAGAAARLPGAVQLRVLLRGLHRPHGHGGRGGDAVPAHAAHGARGLERGVPGAAAPAAAAGQAGRATDSHTMSGSARPNSRAASVRTMSSMPIQRSSSVESGAGGGGCRGRRARDPARG